MQLSKVKISNLFNFPFQADFSKLEWIIFSNPDKDNVNILIGPNGAGKSSFLNVLHGTWHIGLMKDYTYNKNILSAKNIKDFKRVITLNELLIPKSRKHFASPGKESRVSIEFVLTNHDYENIWCIFKYRHILNSIISKYSSFTTHFPDINLGDIRDMRDKISFEFVWDLDKKTISVVEKWLSSLQKFVLMYFRYMELIQICIDIYNEVEKAPLERKIYPLKYSFALLNTHRSLEWVSNEIDPNVWHSYLSGQNSPEYESFFGGFLCVRKIWNILTYASEENIREHGKIVRGIPFGDLSPQSIDKKLKKSDFYKSLIFALRKYLDKDLLIEYKNWKLVFWLVDNNKRLLSFDDLSDGEQSLLVIIFTIYGYDLKYWSLVIDEPEISFHPQMQRSFVRMIEKISSNIGTQFIVSTYSPLFIDEVNIKNVYRFATIDGNVIVKNPTLRLDAEESNLIHLLKFENMSKIFFANKIIMVEGETDQYFFEFYLKYLHSLPQWKDTLKDYEIININGKWGYKMWRNFLSKFGIRSYFIGDWDNIIDFDILQQHDLNHYYKEAKHYHESHKKDMSPYYSRLVNTMKDLHPEKYAFIIKKIKNLYKDNIFIMEKWDLETYLGIREKWLQETVTFCHQYFQKRYNNKKFDDHRVDLNNIFEWIFKPTKGW